MSDVELTKEEKELLARIRGTVKKLNPSIAIFTPTAMCRQAPRNRSIQDSITKHLNGRFTPIGIAQIRPGKERLANPNLAVTMKRLQESIDQDETNFPTKP